jgi:hypothetical protein
MVPLVWHNVHSMLTIATLHDATVRIFASMIYA